VRADDHPARGYAPVGEPVTMDVPDPHIGMNQISTITNEGVVRFMTYARTMNAALFLVFLGRLLRGTTGKLFVIVDRLRAHETPEVAAGVVAMAGLLPLGALLEMTNIGTLFAFAVVCGAVLVMRYTNPNVPRPFRCPLVPVVPAAGVLGCLLLMFSLPAHNWVRLFLWMALGLALYFVYGRRHSLIGRLKT
jgi:amino acid transporter